MRIHLELTVEPPRLSRPRRPRTLIGLGALAIALLLPAVALASHTFADVPTSSTFHTNIANLAGAGVTAGCGGNNYCPDAPVTRGEMAAFLNRGLGRVAEADFSPTDMIGTPWQAVGSLTITPGTSPGALPGAKQFIRGQFNGYVDFANVNGCPCDFAFGLSTGPGGSSSLSTWAGSLKVTTARAFAPFSTGGVIAVTGNSPVTVTLWTSLILSGNSTTEYYVTGNLTAETIPFGHTGASSLGAVGQPAPDGPPVVPTGH